jgi:acylphosphatase
MTGAGRLHATVHGDVQGVGFRWFVQRRAAQLGLAGWVANRPDGTVEVVAEGPRDSLDQLLEALRRGPSGAAVPDVNAEFETPRGDLDGFQIRG